MPSVGYIDSSRRTRPKASGNDHSRVEVTSLEYFDSSVPSSRHPRTAQQLGHPGNDAGRHTCRPWSAHGEGPSSGTKLERFRETADVTTFVSDGNLMRDAKQGLL